MVVVLVVVVWPLTSSPRMTSARSAISSLSTIQKSKKCPPKWQICYKFAPEHNKFIPDTPHRRRRRRQVGKGADIWRLPTPSPVKLFWEHLNNIRHSHRRHILHIHTKGLISLRKFFFADNLFLPRGNNFFFVSICTTIYLHTWPLHLENFIASNHVNKSPIFVLERM